MPLIDDDGNLFGVVNVIDALVVVVLIAVLVAGVAIVAGLGGSDEVGDDPADPETRYVTVELGEQPGYVLNQFEEGDRAEASGWGSGDPAASVTVTDTFVTHPAANETNASTSEPAAVTARLEVEGVPAEDDRELEEFLVDGEALALGSDLVVDRGTYAANGTVTDIDRERETLETESTTTAAEVEARNVTPSVADALDEGVTETVGDESVATIQSVESEPATVVLESDDGELHEREHPQNVDVTLTVELLATETATGVEFQGQRLGTGTDVVIDFDAVTVEGEVIDLE